MSYCYWLIICVIPFNVSHLQTLSFVRTVTLSSFLMAEAVPGAYLAGLGIATHFINICWMDKWSGGWIDAVLVEWRPVQISARSLWGMWVILRDRWAKNSNIGKSRGQTICIDGKKAFPPHSQGLSALRQLHQQRTRIPGSGGGRDTTSVVWGKGCPPLRVQPCPSRTL